MQWVLLPNVLYENTIFRYTVLMPETHAQATLEGRIRYSVLLTDDRREALLAAVQTMSEEKREALRAVLALEESMLRAFVLHAVSEAAMRGDAAFLMRLDEFLRRAKITLRRESEGAQNDDDAASADALLSRMS